MGAAVVHLPEPPARIVARIEARSGAGRAAGRGRSRGRPAQPQGALAQGPPWPSGPAGSYTDEQLGQLEGRGLPARAAPPTSKRRAPATWSGRSKLGRVPGARVLPAVLARHRHRRGQRRAARRARRQGRRLWGRAAQARLAARARVGRLEESIFGNRRAPDRGRPPRIEEAQARGSRGGGGGRPPPRNRSIHFIGGCHWSCTRSDWMIRKRELPEPEQRVCKHILGIQDDLDVASNARDVRAGRPESMALAPGQLYADGNGYKLVYMFLNPGRDQAPGPLDVGGRSAARLDRPTTTPTTWSKSVLLRSECPSSIDASKSHQSARFWATRTASRATSASREARL